MALELLYVKKQNKKQKRKVYVKQFVLKEFGVKIQTIFPLQKLKLSAP